MSEAIDLSDLIKSTDTSHYIGLAAIKFCLHCRQCNRVTMELPGLLTEALYPKANISGGFGIVPYRVKEGDGLLDVPLTILYRRLYVDYCPSCTSYPSESLCDLVAQKIL